MDPLDLRLWSGYEQAGGSPTLASTVDNIVIDSRRINSPHSLFIALKGSREDGHVYVANAQRAGAKFALVSKEWRAPDGLDHIQLLRVEDPLKAFQEVVKAYRGQLKTKIIGITGSFGKTMVKDLLLDLLTTQKKATASPESFNSQIGVPLSLLQLNNTHEIAIIEAAISQVNEMNVLADIIKPDYTILTPLGKKHLTTLESFSILAHETLKLILSTPKEGWALLPQGANKQFSAMANPFPVYFWDHRDERLPHAMTKDRTPLSSEYIIKFPNNTLFEWKTETPYAYFLNLINMAIKAAWLSGIEKEAIVETLAHYTIEPSRTEIWKSPIGATIVNDTYCSDPQSVERSLLQYQHAIGDSRKIFIFGGLRHDKAHSDNDYRLIGKTLGKTHIDLLLCVGEKNFHPLIEEIELASPQTIISTFADYSEALHYLQPKVLPDDFLLFKGDKKLSFDELTETLNESLNNNQCLINLAAIESNLTILRKQLNPDCRLMPIVKAFAYGTDEVRMAKFLGSCGIDILGVSYVDEGIALRRAGVEQEIFSINAAIYEASKVVHWNMQVGVSDAEFIRKLSEESKKQSKPIKVHLHINTGMGRFGCRPEEALKLAELIRSLPHLELEGLMTHFASAEDPSQDDFTIEQSHLFDNVIEELRVHGIEVPWKHAANSSATIRFKFKQYNMARIGLAIYGLYTSESTRKALDLRLALTLSSRIVGINNCKEGETISYGRSYQVKRKEERIAVLPIGYFDGLHRNYSGKGHVLIKGKRAPMVGKICMDFMMVDVTEIPEARVGDRVLIFGEDEFGQYLDPEEFATSGDSIVHELITCLGPRIQRVFIYEETNQTR